MTDEGNHDGSAPLESSHPTSLREATVSRGAGEGFAASLAGGLVLLALALVLWHLSGQVPASVWMKAALAPAADDPAQLIFHFATLPRLAVAALAGAGLAAAGTIFQHVLHNPLASPVTLGVSSGAQLALLAASIFAPATLGLWPDLTALAGGLGAMGLVLAVASAQRFSPLALILSGLSVGLFCGALGHLLKLFNQEYLAAIFLWGAGALDQDGWWVALMLLPRLVGLAVLVLLLLQPLRLLGFADENARGLGLFLALFRTATLAVAVGFAAVVTASVGMIGFIEIAAPLIAQLAGARRLGTRLVLAPLIGAALLLIVDTLVQALNARFGASLPTGAATAFLGAPLVLWLLPRMRGAAGTMPQAWGGAGRHHSPWRMLAILAGTSVLAVLLACLIGRTGQGWSWLTSADAATLLPWRLPRTITAFSAGAMLAAAGTLLQRATGNPLASPEILGLGAAVMAGLALALVVHPTGSAAFLLAMGAAGALALLLVLFWDGLRSRFAPDKLLLTGVALTAALDAVVIGFLAVNDSRSALLLSWMSGSTADASAGPALTLLGLTVLLVPLGLLLARSLDVLPLGDAVASGLGVALGPVRFAIMGLAALFTAGAVLAVGPLTFVGLVGPHVAHRLGLARSAVQLPGAALVGGLVMVLADWLGRTVAAPFELPAGLVASLIGCPYLVLQLRRRG